jgi:putative flippase GtrA
MLRSFLRNLLSGPVAPQLRRFVTVGIVAAGVQMGLLWAFVDVARLHYLSGAVVAIETTIVFSYVLNNAWTFRQSRHTGTADYLTGLVKTNLVRGTAIPIQIGVLFALVEGLSISYLIGNVVGIGISGIYRFVLDARWTWG